MFGGVVPVVFIFVPEEAQAAHARVVRVVSPCQTGTHEDEQPAEHREAVDREASDGGVVGGRIVHGALDVRRARHVEPVSAVGVADAVESTQEVNNFQAQLQELVLTAALEEAPD